jgi:hypothetical protein
MESADSNSKTLFSSLKEEGPSELALFSNGKKARVANGLEKFVDCHSEVS